MSLQFSIPSLSPFLYMADMIPVLEVTNFPKLQSRSNKLWCQTFPRSHKHLKGQDPASSLEKCL